MSRLLSLCLCFCLMLASPVWSEPTPVTAIPRQQKSAQKRQIIQSNTPRKNSEKQNAPAQEETARTGYLLMDLESGQILDSQHADDTFIPASVSKVPSTLAALHILGSDYRFTTSAQTLGVAVNGVLQGDLILVGGGDPALTMAGLMNLALQLRQKGVSQVQGRFLYDESALITGQNISDEQNEEETYNQGVSALSLDFNRVRLNWSMNPAGQLLIQMVPNLGYVSLQPGPSSRTGPALTYLGGTQKEEWRLNPRGTRSGWDWVPIKRPAYYTAQVFREFARQAGVQLPPPEPGRTQPDATLLASHVSPPLSDLIDLTLEHSNNLWTELIAMTAATQLTGKPQSSTEAAQVLTRWLIEQQPEVDWKGYHLANNCGLTAASRISPRQMLAILKLANTTLAGDRAFASLLPISGWKGTLTRSFSSAESSLRVWAKTGTILYGKALAGYLFTQKNHRLAFAVFVSDFEARKAFDAKKGQHSPTDLSTGRLKTGQASGQIAALVERWLRTY